MFRNCFSKRTTIFFFFFKTQFVLSIFLNYCWYLVFQQITLGLKGRKVFCALDLGRKLQDPQKSLFLITDFTCCSLCKDAKNRSIQDWNAHRKQHNLIESCHLISSKWTGSCVCNVCNVVEVPLLLLSSFQSLNALAVAFVFCTSPTPYMLIKAVLSRLGAGCVSGTSQPKTAPAT